MFCFGFMRRLARALASHGSIARTPKRDNSLAGSLTTDGWLPAPPGLKFCPDYAEERIE